MSDDGRVGSADLMAMLSSWGDCAAPCPADINCAGDDWVGFDDVVMLLNAWGPCS